MNGKIYMTNEDIINKKLIDLSKSKFRSSFHLNEKMIIYINEQGLKRIKEHAIYFIENRLAAAKPKNDGKQTPMKGHPIFIAQHACACCCRNCLAKWHNISKGKELTNNEKNYILMLLMMWVKKEYIQKKNKK